MKKIQLKMNDLDIDGMSRLSTDQMKEVLGGLSWSISAFTTYTNCSSSCSGDCAKGGGHGECQRGTSGGCYCN